MNPEYRAQAERLEELRRILAQNGSFPAAPSQTAVAQAADPLIYPGLYSPSGFDIMSILIRVYNRPNPIIHIGNVDSAVALVLADAEQPDLPVVYCSEPFETLTGYKGKDIMGLNCRFLQYPPGGQGYQDRQIHEANAASRKELREKIGTGEETRVRLLNYRRDGTLFANLLTIIPIVWSEEGQVDHRYIVGFQADEGRAFF